MDDSIAQLGLSNLLESYPTWVEESLETQEEWVQSLESKYNAIIEESQRREAENKKIEEEKQRKIAIRISIDNTIIEYRSKLSEFSEWINTDEQTKIDVEELRFNKIKINNSLVDLSLTLIINNTT